MGMILPTTPEDDNQTIKDNTKETLVGIAVILGVMAIGGGLLYWAYK